MKPLTPKETLIAFYQAMSREDGAAMGLLLNDESVFSWNWFVYQGTNDILKAFEAWWATISDVVYSPLTLWEAPADDNTKHAGRFTVSYTFQGQHWEVPINVLTQANNSKIEEWRETGYEPDSVLQALETIRNALTEAYKKRRGQVAD